VTAAEWAKLARKADLDALAPLLGIVR